MSGVEIMSIDWNFPGNNFGTLSGIGEAGIRKFDQVRRLQLFLYHIWKRCKSGRDLENFYTISMSDSKEI